MTQYKLKDAPESEFKFDYNYNPMLRWCALQLDELVFWTIIIPFLLLSYGICSPFLSNDNSTALFNITAFVVSFLVFITYKAVWIKYFGQTLGQKISGLTMLTVSGQKTGFWSLVLRELFGMIPFVNLVSIIMIFSTDDKKTLYDIVFKTRFTKSSRDSLFLIKWLLSLFVLVSILTVLMFIIIGLFSFKIDLTKDSGSNASKINSEVYNYSTSSVN